jgi:hypothetical protein
MLSNRPTPTTEEDTTTHRLSFPAFAIAFTLATLLPASAQQPPAYPAAPKKPVTEIHHGVKVTDDYRWLENKNDPAVRKWIDEENKPGWRSCWPTRRRATAACSWRPARCSP